MKAFVVLCLVAVAYGSPTSMLRPSFEEANIQDIIRPAAIPPPPEVVQLPGEVSPLVQIIINLAKQPEHESFPGNGLHPEVMPLPMPVPTPEDGLHPELMPLPMPLPNPEDGLHPELMPLPMPLPELEVMPMPIPQLPIVPEEVPEEKPIFTRPSPIEIDPEFLRPSPIEIDPEFLRPAVPEDVQVEDLQRPATSLIRSL